MRREPATSVVVETLIAVVEGDALIDNTSKESVPWWSFGKVVLAVAALALAAEGRVALDEPLKGRPYSLRQLLQHRAGLPDYGGLTEYARAVSEGDQPWTETVLLERTRADHLLFEPGRGWAYSNIGYLMVRRLIEEVTGEDIEAALQRLVLTPIGIHEVSLARTPADLAQTAWGNPSGYDPRWVYQGLLVGHPGSKRRERERADHTRRAVPLRGGNGGRITHR